MLTFVLVRFDSLAYGTAHSLREVDLQAAPLAAKERERLAGLARCTRLVTLRAQPLIVLASPVE